MRARAGIYRLLAGHYSREESGARVRYGPGDLVRLDERGAAVLLQANRVEWQPEQSFDADDAAESPLDEAVAAIEALDSVEAVIEAGRAETESENRTAVLAAVRRRLAELQE